MSAPIFYLAEVGLEAVRVGETVDLLGDEGHHAKNVKRLQISETVHLSDGEGLRLIGEVDKILAEGLRIRICNIIEPSVEPNIILVQALAKSDRDTLGIETATELGIRGVIPWAAERSIVRWKKERIEKHHQKWTNTVYAAAKQSRSARIPAVFDLHTSAELARVFEEDIKENSAVWILHENGLHKLSTQLKKQDLAELTTIYLVVGPEGGISDREVQLFQHAGAKLALLGPEVLRSSTAGAAALAVLKTVMGQW